MTDSTPKQAGEWMCPNCGDTVDLQEPSKEWDCSYCGETMEPRKKTDVTPNDELRDLIEELEKLSENHKQSDETWHHGFGCGLGRCVNELERLIDDE